MSASPVKYAALLATGSTSMSEPAMGAFAITPADEDLSSPTRGIWVGVTGNLTVVMLDDSTVTFENVPVGIFPIMAKRVSAATTATKLVGLT